MKEQSALLKLALSSLLNKPEIQKIFDEVLIPIASLIENTTGRKGCIVTCFISGPGNSPDHERGDMFAVQFGTILPSNIMFAGEKTARCAIEDSAASSQSMHAPLVNYATIPFHALKGFQFAGCVRTTETDRSHNYVSVSGFNQISDELIAAVLQFVFFGKCVDLSILRQETQAKLAEALEIAEAKKHLFNL